MSLDQSLSNNNKPVCNKPLGLPTAQSPPSPLVISLTGARPFGPPSDTKMDASFLSSTASISPPEKVICPSSGTRRSYDTSRLLLQGKSRPRLLFWEVVGLPREPLLLGTQGSLCLYGIYLPWSKATAVAITHAPSFVARSTVW